MLTKLFYHTGTTSPTDIGPASNGVLHSLTVLTSSVGSVTIKDGGSSGTVLLSGDDGLLFQMTNPLIWKGVRLDGQLNITLSNAGVKVIVEMSELL
jgi:hypothetical protein